LRKKQPPISGRLQCRHQNRHLAWFCRKRAQLQRLWNSIRHPMITLNVFRCTIWYRGFEHAFYNLLNFRMCLGTKQSQGLVPRSFGASGSDGLNGMVLLKIQKSRNPDLIYYIGPRLTTTTFWPSLCRCTSETSLILAVGPKYHWQIKRPKHGWHCTGSVKNGSCPKVALYLVIWLHY
jgi:hypothetical protein